MTQERATRGVARPRTIERRQSGRGGRGAGTVHDAECSAPPRPRPRPRPFTFPGGARAGAPARTVHLEM
ncbi:hypothetical protein R5R35_013397 [Gryllus longicercus]|uniref:Uncharacterized protein n=1 Tax=Gryllus longicercus TaxID=2509291 RepID=A0AAN9VYP5_9ORTH